MGQYQQWLHYQEIDRQLQRQLETLEARLVELQDRLQLLEQEQQEQLAFLADNPIIQALAARLNSHDIPPKSTIKNTEFLQSAEPGVSISPALLAWGGLPNFGLQEIEESESTPGVEKDLPSVNHPEIELLPEDMMAFFEGYAQTDPRLEIPWWLRDITTSTSNMHENQPTDLQSIRTNHLVERWIERWGRQSLATLKPAEKEGEGAHE
jgi:hypothetical protein